MNESIRLSISHPTASGLIEGFRYLWAYHVRGYHPQKHCQDCFIGFLDPAFHTRNAATGEFTFTSPSDEVLYLCGVAAGKVSERRGRNLHLPLRFSLGSTGSFTTYNGYVVHFEDAELLPIPEPRPRDHLPEDHYRCANFRFAESWFGDAAR